MKGKDEVQEIYIDGWTQFFLGYPFTKILFHSLSDPASGTTPETRRAAVTLCMPTVLAVQMAQTILAATKANERAVVQAAEQGAAQLKQLLAAQMTLPMPVDVVEERHSKD